MNVPLPGQEDRFAFDIIVGVSVAFFGAGMLYFVKARWFR
jgi:Mg2+ and Co2+ transporter CorA